MYGLLCIKRMECSNCPSLGISLTVPDTKCDGKISFGPNYVLLYIVDNNITTINYAFSADQNVCHGGTVTMLTLSLSGRL